MQTAQRATGAGGGVSAKLHKFTSGIWADCIDDCTNCFAVCTECTPYCIDQVRSAAPSAWSAFAWSTVLMVQLVSHCMESHFVPYKLLFLGFIWSLLACLPMARWAFSDIIHAHSWYLLLLLQAITTLPQAAGNLAELNAKPQIT